MTQFHRSKLKGDLIILQTEIMRSILLSLIVGAAFWATSCEQTPDPAPVDKPEEEIKAVTSLKVMSYNIHYGNPPSRPNVIDLDAIVNVIKGEKPDMVALQEVDVNTTRSGKINQAQLIASKLNMRYFFAKAIDYQGGDYGIMILSKYPLSETVVHRLPTKAGSGGEPRVLATAKVSLPDGTAVRFGNTHMDSQADPTNRQMQIERIVEISATDALPFIIAGDLNATPDSDVIRFLDANFTRTCQICASTFPATAPTKVIDYIAYKHPQHKFSVGSHRVLPETYASDHRPVVSVINVQQ